MNETEQRFECKLTFTIILSIIYEITYLRLIQIRMLQSNEKYKNVANHKDYYSNNLSIAKPTGRLIDGFFDDRFNKTTKTNEWNSTESNANWHSRLFVYLSRR